MDERVVSESRRFPKSAAAAIGAPNFLEPTFGPPRPLSEEPEVPNVDDSTYASCYSRRYKLCPLGLKAVARVLVWVPGRHFATSAEQMAVELGSWRSCVRNAQYVWGEVLSRRKTNPMGELVRFLMMGNG
jgi:hypothetical protein